MILAVTYSTIEADLRLLFAQADNVISVDLIQDQDSVQSNGFAFVTMDTQAKAREAMDLFNA